MGQAWRGKFLSEWFGRLPWRRGLFALLAVAGLAGGLWAYDALGYRRLEAATALHADDPPNQLREWERYQAWHPTRSWFRVLAADAEREQIQGLRRAARASAAAAALAELRGLAASSEHDPEDLARRLRQFLDANPEMSADPATADLVGAVEARRRESEEKRAMLRLRSEERAIEPARALSLAEPLHFQARRERYLSYLERHPDGAFTQEALTALRQIAEQWDRHDFRKVRDHFTERPGEVGPLVTLCRGYLAAHPDGRFTSSATDLLRWSERVTAPGAYRVVLRGGQFERGLARYFSQGPDLSVELEVNGVRHGPSPICKNRYDPDWAYEFPRRVYWKLGDPVHIRVTDHDWGDRVVLNLASLPGEPLAMRFLSGPVYSEANMLTFESDFTMPVLPAVE